LDARFRTPVSSEGPPQPSVEIIRSGQMQSKSNGILLSNPSRWHCRSRVQCLFSGGIILSARLRDQRDIDGMSRARASELFPMGDAEASGAPANFFRSTGLWPAQLLRAAVHQAHEIQSAAPIEDDQVQPASLDLRLGEVAYRVRASFLPGPGASVHDKLDRLSMHQIDLS